MSKAFAVFLNLLLFQQLNSVKKFSYMTMASSSGSSVGYDTSYLPIIYIKLTAFLVKTKYGGNAQHKM